MNPIANNIKQRLLLRKPLGEVFKVARKLICQHRFVDLKTCDA